MSDETMIAALLHERAGYARLGQAERVAQVDEQLRLRGVTPPADDTTEQAQPASRSAPPKGRRSKRAETA